MIITAEEYKQLKNITDTSKDKLIEALIPYVEEDYFLIRGRSLKEGEEYPLGSKLVAADMLSYRIQHADVFGISSESIGDYSVSYESSGNNMYPLSIVRRIKRYAEVHT